MNTEQDVENFWNEVNRLLEQNKSADPIYEYRLYHDSDGNITSGFPLIINRPEPEDLPKGSYVVVNRDEYENHSGKIIKDGTLEKKNIVISVTNQLKKSLSGYKVAKNHAALLLDNDEQYPEIEFYDRRTN